jgi:ABC-type phosphate transport system auxiliary subunit
MRSHGKQSSESRVHAQQQIAVEYGKRMSELKEELSRLDDEKRRLATRQHRDTAASSTITDAASTVDVERILQDYQDNADAASRKLQLVRKKMEGTDGLPVARCSAR